MGLTTLCYLEKDDRYLMLHRIKKEVDVNKDKWIGVGGHFEKDETPEECLLREVKEETGLTLTSWRFRGLVTFLSDAWEKEYMCLYTADGFEGDIITNPPYSVGLEFVQKALESVRPGGKVAMFLKVQFLEGQKRGAFFKDTPPPNCLHIPFPAGLL